MTSLLKLCLVFALLPAATLLAEAEPSPQNPLRLDQALQAVKENNPAYKAALAEAGMAKAEAGASWALPDPQIGLEFWDIPRPGFDLGQADQRWLDFSQEIPFPSKLYYQAKVAAHEAVRQAAKAESVLQDQMLMAKQAFWDFYEANAALKALSQSAKALDDLAVLVAQRKQLGRLGRMQEWMLPMARMEKAGLQNQRLALRQQSLEAEARLKRLMGLNDPASLGQPLLPELDWPEDLDEQSFLKKAQAHRPDLAEARHHLNHTLALQGLARAGWWPDLMLQLSLVDRPGGPASSMLMAKLNLPFIYFWRQQAELNSAQRQVEHSQAMLQEQEAQTLQDGRAAWQAFQNDREQWKQEQESILPQARQALDLARTGFASGSVSAADSLEAVKIFWMSQSEAAHLQAQLGRDYAQLEALAGGSLAFNTEENHEEHQH